MIKKIIKLIKRKKPKVIKRVNGVNFVDAFIDDYGVYHPIKGEEKIKVPSENSEEFKMAVWIKENLGGRISMVPEMKQEKGNKNTVSTQTPDYIWNNDYYTKVEKIVKMHNKTSEELKKIKHNPFLIQVKILIILTYQSLILF